MDNKKFSLTAFLLLFVCRFVIGREKEGVESEVARLINESLEMDKTSRKVCFLKKKKSDVSTTNQFDCVAL